MSENMKEKREKRDCEKIEDEKEEVKAGKRNLMDEFGEILR